MPAVPPHPAAAFLRPEAWLSHSRPVVRAAGGALVTIFAACGPYQHYRPMPLDRAAVPAATAAYEARTLKDSALGAFLARHGASPTLTTTDSNWTPHDLGLAVLYRRAELDEGRALLAGAMAAAEVAGAPAEPSASAALERASRPDEGKASPWTYSLAAEITVETGGKRGARRARGRAGILSARLELDAQGWQLAQEATRDATALGAAELEVQDLEAEAAALRSAAELVQGRYAEGRVSSAELARAEADVRAAMHAVADARRTRAEAAGALAHALAVPLAALDALGVRTDGMTGCDLLDTVPIDTLRALALQRRSDLGAALADYAIAEADLRLEIARQYPDLTLGPGIAWDQGVVRWVLSVGALAIPRARNRGPIAEATARRRAQAAQVYALQDSILTAVDAAAASCAAARGEWVAADSLRQAAQRSTALLQAAYDRGEVGSTEVALAQVGSLRSERVLHQAEQHHRAAGATLETAVGTWLSDRRIWPDLRIGSAAAEPGRANR